MELALAYALKSEERKKEREREEALEDIPTLWYPMHAAPDHTISVFAGRGTGKTPNIARRVARSQYDCIVYTVTDVHMRVLIEAIELEIRGHAVSERVDNGLHRIMLSDGRIIDICKYTSTLYQGQSWTNREIFFDEFEHSDFGHVMEAKRGDIPRARQIICVGSINRMEDSYAKRWFKGSKLHYYVDTDFAPPTRGHLSEEYTPSRARYLIANLPPIGVTI